MEAQNAVDETYIMRHASISQEPLHKPLWLRFISLPPLTKWLWGSLTLFCSRNAVLTLSKSHTGHEHVPPSFLFPLDGCAAHELCLNLRSLLCSLALSVHVRSALHALTSSDIFK